MEVGSMKSSKVDLHVHSKYSTTPSYWMLQKIGCSESYTEPLKLYSIAMDSGMDFVTITDHDSVAGSLEIAHLRNTFVSEEITTYFPLDGCKLHVLAYGITERQHADISTLRENVFELVEYLNQEGIVHAVAHPMYSINNLLTIKHFEQQIILFKTFELNGSQDACQNNILSRILKNLTPDAIELLANKYNLKPYGDRPWEKNLIGGSDDHSSLSIASTYTEIEGVSSVKEFLRGIAQNKAYVRGRSSDPKAMAHSLYSIAYQFYKNKFHIAHKVNKDIVLRFVDNTLSLSNNKESDLAERLVSFISCQRPKYFFNSTPKGLQGLFRESAREVIREDLRMYKLIKKREIESSAMSDVWFGFVDKVSEKMLKKFADSILKSLSNANLLDIFQVIGSVGSLYTSLALYFVGYTHFRKGLQFCSQCHDHFLEKGEDLPEEQIKIAHFTDTYNDVNGVAKTLQMQLKIAKQNNKALTMIVCGPKSEASGVVNFPPIGTFELPEYPGMKLYYPPLLKMLDYCFKQKFTHIHSATPGPVGLAALAIARILKLPLYGAYHAALSQCVSRLTNDSSMEEIMRKYVIWYYNQMDIVFTPSEATAEDFSNAGILEEKIHLYPRGIDIESFSPSNRNGFF
ncbi:glycosyltransferase [Thermodesulfovibrionales bacterium]|nr:glycosyltransferase [Thermodesulfovibrionales bacterium]